MLAKEELDWKFLDLQAELSKDYLARLDACKTAEEVAAFVDLAYEELLSNKEFADSNKTNVEGTPNYLYNEWYNTMWPPEG